jgi:hypothetical protein
MTVSGEHNPICADCGVTITGVPVVPSDEGPTRAQIEKLKPTVYLCAECAEERGLAFDRAAIGRGKVEAPQT